MAKKKRIPLSMAKAISRECGFDQIIIFGHDKHIDGDSYLTTYGKNPENCAIAKAMGDYFMDVVEGKCDDPTNDPYELGKRVGKWMTRFSIKGVVYEEGDDYDSEMFDFIMGIGDFIAGKTDEDMRCINTREFDQREKDHIAKLFPNR